jgi:hypothetical protein
VQEFSILSGPCSIGVKVTPWSMALAAHSAFVKAAFLLPLGFLTFFCMGQGSRTEDHRARIDCESGLPGTGNTGRSTGGKRGSPGRMTNGSSLPSR